MNFSRCTLGIGLAMAVSLWGLLEANASPFSMFVLADDLGNRVNGSAPEQYKLDDGGDSDSGGGNGNNGHGNNEDGVDSSNPGKGGGGPNGEDDASCPEGGECVDDESGGGNKGKGKKK